MFARLPEAAKMMAAKMNASTISTSRAASPLGRETKSSCSNMRDRSGGRPIELVADPIVGGDGSDQFQRKLVYVALGEALPRPTMTRQMRRFNSSRNFRSRRDRTKVEEPLVVISPPSDSLSSRTESPSSPSSNVESFQSTLVKMRDTMYFVTVFIKPAPGSS
jgi:hypothetical protein